jgi:hypothetical protein
MSVCIPTPTSSIPLRSQADDVLSLFLMIRFSIGNHHDDFPFHLTVDQLAGGVLRNLWHFVRTLLKPFPEGRGSILAVFCVQDRVEPINPLIRTDNRL